MSTTSIVLCVLAFIGMLCVIIYYAHKSDQLSIDNRILKRRNDTLEICFEKGDEQASAALGQPETGVEILQAFAQSHQVRLAPQNYNDEHWELYHFTYQGGHFYSYVSKQSEEILIRFMHFDAMPYSDAALSRISRLCYDYTSNMSYVKLIYSLETTEGEREIHLHLYYDLIGATQSGIEFLLGWNFNCVREVCNALDDIRKEVEELHSADNNISKTDADYQAMAIYK